MCVENLTLHCIPDTFALKYGTSEIGAKKLTGFRVEPDPQINSLHTKYMRNYWVTLKYTQSSAKLLTAVKVHQNLQI